ncbi:MAG: homoserine O-succinyltransferase [Rhizomicrobium sp.]
MPSAYTPARINIGLVNNMPDAALARTEQQFLDVLTAAAPECAIDLHLFHIPSVPRGELGRTHLSSRRYRDISKLNLAGLDGLIVTGTEPRQSDLRNEPYWSDLTGLFDWIAELGPSTVFSCLATHAAVLHYDAIARHRLDNKCFGLFAHSTTAHHVLTQHLPAIAKVPHSRWNEITATDLAPRGYQVLTEAPGAGVDLFVKKARNPLLFFQGHPEYDDYTLFREYRRDVLRYLMGEHENYPCFPENYFDDHEIEQLRYFHDNALAKRDTALMQAFPISSPNIAVADEIAPAPKMYRAWLSQISDVAPFEERRKVPQLAGWAG